MIYIHIYSPLLKNKEKLEKNKLFEDWNLSQVKAPWLDSCFSGWHIFIRLTLETRKGRYNKMQIFLPQCTKKKKKAERWDWEVITQLRHTGITAWTTTYKDIILWKNKIWLCNLGIFPVNCIDQQKIRTHWQ